MKYLLIIAGLLLPVFLYGQQGTALKKTKAMQVAVWDTYVTKKDGSTMHFDIIVPADMKDTSVIYRYGKAYLHTKEQDGQPLTSKECKFCHVEAVKPQWEADIRQKGYYIYEMENCN